MTRPDQSVTVKSVIWYPIAVGATIINLLGLGYAVGTAEPQHAMTHGALAVAFGVWARRLRQDPGGGELKPGREGLEALEALEAEVSKLRQELGEMQERLDFVERLLAQGETRRVGPQL